MQKVIRYRFGGGLGNRMFEVMLAHSLAERIPGLVVAGPRLAEWRIAPPNLPLPVRHVKIGGHKPDVPRLAYLLAADIIDGIETIALGCRMEMLPSRDLAQRLFPAGLATGHRVGDDTLLIDIRGGEIFGPAHPAYRPLPIAFYERLVAETGLKPAFSGQIGDDAYSVALRARFPTATFLPSLGPMENFATIRHARHVCIPISTFCWLAAWLGEAETVHLPVAGMYHPRLRPDVDMLPVADPRYRFHFFKAREWKGTPEEVEEAISAPEPGRTMPWEEAVRLAHGMVVLEAAG